MDENETKAIDFVSRGEGLPFIALLSVKTEEENYLEVRVEAITREYIAVSYIKGEMEYRELVAWSNIEFLRTKRREQR